MLGTEHNGYIEEMGINIKVERIEQRRMNIVVHAWADCLVR